MEFATYILTGGNSTRMGADKALQQYKNNSFLFYITSAVKSLSLSFKLVSSKAIHHQLGYNYIMDIKKDKGPVSGITSALKDSLSEWNLILSCDTPLLQSSFLEWLLENYSPKHDATICLVDEKKMSLTAIYNKSCVTVFEKHLQQDQLRVMSVIENLNVKYISVPTELRAQLANINTPEQLKEISI